MKLNRIACTAALFLLFGFIAPAPCLQSQQGEKHERVQGEESKQTQAEARHQQPPQEPRQFHLSLKPSLQAKPQPPINDNPQQQYERGDRGQQERTQQQQQFPDKSRDGGNRDRREHERPGYYRHDHPNDWQGRRARDWRSDHRTWEQRGGYHGYRIPEYRFGQYFGPSHFFRIHDLPVLVFSGYPRFLYGGYWFRLVDPWPEYWADDWYETDDVYIVYAGDGYYLFNRRYPGVGIAVSISMQL